MFRAVLFLFTMFVNTELKSLEHSVYISRKSRASSPVLQAGYYYNKINNEPATLSMYGNDDSAYRYSLEKSRSYPVDIGSTYNTATLGLGPETGITSFSADPSSKYDYERSKSEADYNSHYYPSKMKTDAMYEKLKSIMHYKYPEAMGDISYYDVHNDYHIDDDDVRSSSRASYDGWPYYYHSPYEYESMKIDNKIEKVKDKRYVTGVIKDVIPVHEHIDDVPTPPNSRFDRALTTDNPIYGDKPFLSFVLNDYLDKTSDDDHLSFKGMDWGKEFDHEAPPVDQRKVRRLEVPYSPEQDGYFNGNSNHADTKVSLGESSTEKSHSKKHAFDKHEKGDEKQEQHKAAYEHNGNNYNGFKNFVDTFANKFGGEEQKKDGKYSLLMNEDKGENRKGFHRVYHKDEYQEDKEFYDNKKKSAKAEEKGSSALHNGGSNAILQSHAAASLGNEANAFSNAESNNRNGYEKNHKGHDNSQDHDSQLKRYKDVAKVAARSNNADYVNY